MNDQNPQGDQLAQIRTFLRKAGPQSALTIIGDLCAEVAENEPSRRDLWESAALTAWDARQHRAGADDDDDERGDQSDRERDENEGEDDDVAATPASDDPATQGATLSGDGGTEPSHSPKAETQSPKRTRMPKEDQLGPRPPMATHWRCRRIEDDGKKSTLLFHDDGCGIAVCEWPIKSCNPETIRERWGGAGGAFVVQFIHADENGLRRPCGRSRMLFLVASEPADPGPEVSSALANPHIPPNVTPASQSHGDDSFKQLLSLLAYMQDRDEKMRAAAREEARIAIERLRADNELQIERERLASKERLAQFELSAKATGRHVAAPSLDPELLATRIGEAVGAKLEEFYEQDDGDAAPIALTPPAPPDALAKILEILQPIAQAAGPLLAQKLIDGTPPGPTPPGTPLRVIDGGNNGPQ